MQTRLRSFGHAAQSRRQPHNLSEYAACRPSLSYARTPSEERRAVRRASPLLLDRSSARSSCGRGRPLSSLHALPIFGVGLLIRAERKVERPRSVDRSSCLMRDFEQCRGSKLASILHSYFQAVCNSLFCTSAFSFWPVLSN